MTDGAPSTVARNVFETLLEKKKQLPFEEIVLCTVPAFKKYLDAKFEDLTVISTREIFSINKSIIHIPVSPLIFPNTKFLLHLAAKINHNKLILNYHGDILNEVILRFKYDHNIEFLKIPTCAFLPILLNSSDKLVVNSYLIEYLVKRRYRVKSPEVIPNAIDDYWFLGDCDPEPKNDDIVEIFYHGRLSPEKGVDLLIKGLHHVVSNNDKLKNKIILYVAGDGPQKTYLQNLSRELNLETNVIFLGNLGKESIKSFLKKVDVAIYPSRFDTFCLAVMESFACAECPVYFSKKAGIYDFTIKDGYSLNSFEPNIKSIARIITLIFRGAVNRKTVELQKKFAERYKWNIVIHNYIDIYNNLIAKQ